MPTTTSQPCSHSSRSLDRPGALRVRAVERVGTRPTLPKAGEPTDRSEGGCRGLQSRPISVTLTLGVVTSSLSVSAAANAG